MFPEEEVEECRICGEPIKGEEVSIPTKAIKVLKKHKEKLQEEAEESEAKFAKIEDGNLILENQDGEVAGGIEEVESVSLKTPEGEIGKIKNPDYAEFPKIFDVQSDGEEVELQLGSQKSEEEEFIEKIEKLRSEDEEAEAQV